jgi:hypothetical protein
MAHGRLLSVSLSEFESGAEPDAGNGDRDARKRRKPQALERDAEKMLRQRTIFLPVVPATAAL